MTQIMNSENLWAVWVLVGLSLVLAEAVIPGFVILPIGIGCILTGIVAYSTPNAIIIWSSFAVFQFASMFIARNYLAPLVSKPRVLTNADGMVGQEAIVTQAIPVSGTGYVKLYGDEWTAKSFSEHVIEVGSHVIITKTEGNKVWVKPLLD